MKISLDIKSIKYQKYQFMFWVCTSYFIINAQITLFYETYPGSVPQLFCRVRGWEQQDSQDSSGHQWARQQTAHSLSHPSVPCPQSVAEAGRQSPQDLGEPGTPAPCLLSLKQNMMLNDIHFTKNVWTCCSEWMLGIVTMITDWASHSVSLVRPRPSQPVGWPAHAWLTRDVFSSCVFQTFFYVT